MQIKPLPGYVLVEPIEEEKSSGGLYLPDNSQDKPCKGKVIACGDLVKTYEFPGTGPWKTPSECPVKNGQTIYHKKWVNETIENNGKKYIFVRFEDLLGVLND